MKVGAAKADITPPLGMELEGETTVTAEQFSDAVAGIGDAYAPSLGFGASWGEGVHAGTNAVRPLSWHPECSCFLYDGEPIPLSSGAADAPDGG